MNAKTSSPRLNSGHILADRLDLSGQLHPENRVLRAREAKDRLRHEALPTRNIEASNPHVPAVPSSHVP